MKYIIGRVLAIIVGILVGFFGVFNSVFSDAGLHERLISIGVIFIIYAVFGCLLGYLLPRSSWIWGLFLGVPGALFLFLYLLSEFNLYYMLYIVLLIVVACLAAYGGSRLQSRKNNRV